jgi:AcrR family transcriptional regulator
MNTMSSEKRKYELKARADAQRETRDRIAKVTAELHEELGVANTTVSEIARRADVTRLTVYNHFPDLDSLLPACAAHYGELHPFPDLASQLEIGDTRERAKACLALLYDWYRETEPMFGKLFSDRATVPELDRFLAENIDRDLAELAHALTRGERAKNARVIARVAVDFWTWRRLSLEGLSDAQAAKLMAAAIVDAGSRDLDV